MLLEIMRTLKMKFQKYIGPAGYLNELTQKGNLSQIGLYGNADCINRFLRSLNM